MAEYKASTSPHNACRRRFLPYALVLAAMTMCPVSDAKQLTQDALAETAQPLAGILSNASLGDIVWGQCNDTQAVEGAECGYAM